MLAATLAVWLAQAPVPPSGAPPFSPTLKEWSLGGAFKLKRENFLRWQPLFHPMRGWSVQLRPTTLFELAPTHPRLAAFSLAVESTDGGEAGAGLVRPRLQYSPPGAQTRLGVELPALLFSAAGAGGPRVLRPLAFVSGRF